MRITVLPDSEALAATAAAEIAEWLDDPDHHTAGLAGGSTPRRTYELLREADIDWGSVHGWLTDERHVPLDHPDSNAAMVLDALFDHVPGRLHTVTYEEDAAAAAAAYESELHEMWRRLGEEPPGLVVLGVGPDGHTASLFPGTDALEDDERDYVANWVPHHETWRLTATLPLLASAPRVLFIVSGAAKAEVVAEILGEGCDLPAAVVSRATNDPVWLLDEAAATLLG